MVRLPTKKFAQAGKLPSNRNMIFLIGAAVLIFAIGFILGLGVAEARSHEKADGKAADSYDNGYIDGYAAARDNFLKKP